MFLHFKSQYGKFIPGKKHSFCTQFSKEKKTIMLLCSKMTYNLYSYIRDIYLEWKLWKKDYNSLVTSAHGLIFKAFILLQFISLQSRY